jgi:nicotinamide riboside transporter PnuC
MSKPGGRSSFLDTAVKVVFLLLMAFVVLVEPVLFLVFFVPIVGWFVWSAHSKTAELEKRLAALEKPWDQKPEP